MPFAAHIFSAFLRFDRIVPTGWSTCTKLLLDPLKNFAISAFAWLLTHFNLYFKWMKGLVLCTQTLFSLFDSYVFGHLKKNFVYGNEYNSIFFYSRNNSRWIKFIFWPFFYDRMLYCWIIVNFNTFPIDNSSSLRTWFVRIIT